ncbi:MAG TPA: hypothetical protein VLW45_02590 [Pelomicrobium sp.]|nr:hypothetical protein [Pelomicrobium sp.]
MSERPARTYGGQLLRLTVHIVIGLAVLAAVLTLAAWWLHSSYERGAAESAFVSTLERLDRSTEPAALYAALRDGVRRVSEDDAEITLFWLEGRRHRGDIPALYFMAAYAEAAGWRDRALEYLAAARLAARVDALACPDGNAAIERVERDLGLAPAVALLAGNPDARGRAIRWALDYEAANWPRPTPAWLCGTGSAAPPAPAARAQARAEFEPSFASP